MAKNSKDLNKKQQEVVEKIVKLLNENNLSLEVKPEWNIVIVPNDKKEPKK